MNIVQNFRNLHQSSESPLILANVWDAGGARLVESLGAKAVATTSAGVAWSKGYPDGNVLPVPILAQLAVEIVKAVKIPVSMDVEAGYSNQPAEVAENLKPLIQAGIAGINLEDGVDEPALLAEKISAIKAMAASQGADLFVNARTDVYLEDLAEDDRKAEETLRRAALYRDAGADGLFVPGLTAAGDIAKITEGAGLPINLMASPGLPKLEELTKLGVRRLSAGGSMSQILNKHMQRLAESFLKDGDSGVFGEPLMSYSEMQHLFGG